MKGKMRRDVRGTDIGIELKAGQKVITTEVTNLPDDSEFRYFARPYNSRWGDFDLALFAEDAELS